MRSKRAKRIWSAVLMIGGAVAAGAAIVAVSVYGPDLFPAFFELLHQGFRTRPK
jgi:hypothetical protein